MRRIVLAAFAFSLVASCGYRPMLGDRPAVQPHFGGAPPRIAQMKGQGQSVTFCRETGRTRCDVSTCKGMDLVTYSCSGGRVARCELGKGGC